MITFSWVVLLVFWLSAILYALILDKVPLAAALTVSALLSIYGWRELIIWIFGLRRLVRTHLQVSTEETDFIDQVTNRSRTRQERPTEVLPYFCISSNRSPSFVKSN
jgi:hypothetical protein